MNGIDIAIRALKWISSAVGILLLYQSLYTAIGFFATRKFPKAKEEHRYAVLIAARNEENVVARLIESIAWQDYPKEKVTVFVVADNCTDSTANAARAAGAICYERFDSARRTKGFALQHLVERIREDYGIDAFEGYFIFDADNLLKRDYISRMNEAFDAGEKIVTSYRNTKNFDDSWIAASYALHWLRSVRTEHRARSLLRLATRIQGTGFLFASELIRDGWNYTSFTEDRAFSADAVLKGYRIAYNDAAEFYDEQPVNLKIAFRQRLRWAKGHLQSFTESGGRLLLGIFRRGSFLCYDMLWIVVPENLFAFIRRVLLLALGVAATLAGGGRFLDTGALFFDYAKNFLLGWAGVAFTAAYVLFMERGRVKAMPLWRKAAYCLCFPAFDLIGLISICAALFMKIEWKPIPHTVNARLTDMEDALGHGRE